VTSPQNALSSPTGIDVSIVIVSYNTVGMLRDCLRAIPDSVAPYSCEVYVVDNSSKDGSAEMVRSEFPQVTLIANSDNPGFARANNQALLLASGRHMLLLNPDTEAEPGSLAILVQYLDTHPDVGAVGPMLLNTDGSLQRNGRSFPNPYREFLGHTNLRRYIKGSHGPEWEYGRTNFDEDAEVDSVTGACMMVPAAVMQKVGMLDPAFFMFYEEVEWCWRIKQSGKRIVYIASSRVKHHWMGSVRQQSRKMTIRLFDSMLIYYKKTGRPIDVIAARGVYAAGFLRNEWLHFGVAVKRILRKARLVK
jgi:N-acetylglucosaminyl-diphospho-decaprenol L-rhamnosyltransferase